MVDIGLRVLYRPQPDRIGIIAQTIGEDFSDKVLPSIIHDTLKSVMAQYNAASLLTKRNEVFEPTLERGQNKLLGLYGYQK